MRTLSTVFRMFLLIAIAAAFAAPVNVLSQQKKNDSKTGAEAEKQEPEEDAADYTRKKLDYNPGGKRDPFESLAPKMIEDDKKVKGQFNYEGASLKGIVNTESDAYALAVDSDGFGHVLRKGYRIFGGYVTDITDDGVHLHIVKYGRSLTIIMRLESSKTTIVEENDTGESLIQKPGITIQYRKDAELAEDPTVTIEEVVIPSPYTKTVEEVWFGQKGRETKNTGDSGKQEDSKPAIAISLIDPFDKAEISIPYVLDWTTIKGNGVTYCVVVDDSADFSSPVLVRDGVKTSSLVLDEDTRLPADVPLFWKVTAHDGSGAAFLSRRADMTFTVK